MMSHSEPNRSEAEEKQYRHDVEAMAELLLDIYLDKLNPRPEPDVDVLTGRARSRKIKLLSGAAQRRKQRSQLNETP
jgi:hypothetical protein